jgi:hypothetical protein
VVKGLVLGQILGGGEGRELLFTRLGGFEVAVKDGGGGGEWPSLEAVLEWMPARRVLAESGPSRRHRSRNGRFGVTPEVLGGQPDGACRGGPQPRKHCGEEFGTGHYGGECERVRRGRRIKAAPEGMCGGC